MSPAEDTVTLGKASLPGMAGGRGLQHLPSSGAEAQASEEVSL